MLGLQASRTREVVAEEGDEVGAGVMGGAREGVKEAAAEVDESACTHGCGSSVTVATGSRK